MALDRESYIRGSKILKPISTQLGLPLDHTNFIFAQILAVIFSIWFRKMFNRKTAPTYMRHLVAIITGCWLALFCFGVSETCQLVLFSAVSYAILKLGSEHHTQHVLLVFSMGFLSAMNLKLLVARDPDDYILDFTGPMMIMVQKITSVGYAVADGRLGEAEQEKLTKHRKAHVLQTTPSFLQFMSYNLSFFGILSGPFCFFDDFLDYMRNDTGETRMRELIWRKLSVSFSCLGGYVLLSQFFKWRNLAKPEFYEGAGMVYVVFYISICMIAHRLSFHFAFVLSDALHNSAGFGYNKLTQKWDLATTVRPLSVELAKNPQEQVRNWNISTTFWLRHVVYERAPRKYATFMTFGLSAVWHGFFVGYYFLFSFAHFITIAHRKISKRITPIVLSGGTKNIQRLYTFFGALCYHLIFNYAGMGILLLSFERLYIYSTGSWFFGHMILLAALLIPTKMMQYVTSLVVYGKVDGEAIEKALADKAR